MRQFFSLPIIAAALLALLHATARSEPPELELMNGDMLAVGVALQIAYDAKCERLPRAMRNTTEELRRSIPAHVMQDATDRVQSFIYHKAGSRFCDLQKPLIDQTIAKLAASQ